MLLSRKIPKQGTVVRVYAYRNSTDDNPTVYLGSVQETYKSSFALGGLYENTAPLKACQQSGKFVPLRQEIISFPRPEFPLHLHRWEKIPAYPTKIGQYFVYVDRVPVSFTILTSANFMHKVSTQNLMCLIGGTHSFYAVDFADVQHKLDAGELRAFPEYTDSIYTDMLSFLKGSMQSKVLKALGAGLRDLQNTPQPTAGVAQATELKLCV